MRARQRTIPDDRSPNLSFLITVVLCCLLYWKLAAAKWPSEARPGLAEHNGKLDDSRIASQRFMISRHSQDFNAYKIRYRKQYSSPGEELFRFWLYLDSKLRVLVSKLTHLLQAERRYYLDLNQFSDRTTVEKSKLLGVSRKRRSINADLNAGLEAGQADGQPEPGHDEANQEQRENELESVIDWRYEGGPCLSELVPDEGGCGSCYAMAVVRLFEWLHCRQRPTTPPAKFSAQYMVDCGRPFGLLGCQSGCPLASLNFIRQAGLLADSVMPYRAEERPCLSSGEQWLEINVTDPVTGSRPVKARRHASALVPKSVQSAVVHNRDKWLDELRQQPLLVFVAFPKEFMDYGGGLFEPGQCDQSRLHNMLLVGRGYDKRHKRAYWVLANSFGPDFGESGYVRVPVESVDDGDGTSGQEAPQETQLVRGLANSAQSRLELPCLVDQVNCGEVYYITWTKQANATAATSAAKQSSVLNGGGQQQQVSLASAGSPASGLPWSRVYLYTGANDSAPHKPIGDLVNRATFIMPPEPMSIANKQRQQPPFARLVIEEPRLSDEALYKCDVTYVKGKCPSISLVRVQMMALPERAQIFQVAQPLPPGPTVEPPQQQQQQQQNKRAQWQPLASSQLIGPLNEHDQLRLVCVVSGGRPAPRAVFWRKIDFTGRTINLAPGSLATPSEQTSRSSSPQMSHQQVVEVALNHTLTSADLGARFECHVEHEALESLRPAARIISATTSHNLASNQKLLSARQQQQPDAMLDLHPAHTSINRHDDESLEEGSESSGADTENSLLASSSHHPSAGRGPSPVAPLLDSHVIIDLNVGVQSLDLFLNKLSQNQALLQNGALAAAGAAPTATTTTTVTTTTTTTTTKRADEPSGPLKEGDLIELECIAYNSKPAANITWLNGSDVIGIGANGATSLGELEEAGGGVGSSTRRSIERRLDGASLAWTPGQLSGASGASTARSQRNRRLLQRNHMQLNANGQTYNTHSFLLIKLSRHEHGAQITCQARNGPMREPMTKSIELQVQHAPIVLMEPAAGILVAEYESLAQRHNRENNNNVISSVTGGLLAGASTKTTTTTSQAASEQVQIYCIYSANPLQLVPGTTRWFKDGQPLAITGDSRLTESVTPNGYPMLTIRQVNRHDAGKYDCQLTNSAGTSERLAASEACKLEVNFRPSVQLRIYKTTTSSTVGDQGGGELDLEQALVMPGDEFELACEVLEALPNKIDKFHWFSSTTASGSAGGRAGSLRPFATTEGQRFKLGPLPANFTPSQFACTAINSIGQSEPSNTIELELSHTPGPSFVRPVGSARVRKLILSSSKPALSQHLSPTPVQQHDSRFGVVADETNSDELASSSLGRPLMAGKELMLECATHQLGRPRANLWLWFRNGQTIDDNNNSQAQELLAAGGDAKRDYAMAAHYENPTADLRDNPISDRLQQDLSPSSSSSDRAADRTIGGGQQRRPKPAITRLLASGRYLFIPSIQLAHKGNYSCVAVNRLGSGGTGSSSSSATAAYPSQSGGPGRDSYQLSVALAPSFVQPLASKTFWPETQTAILVGSPSTTTTSTSSSASEQRHKQLELVCHVQCEPICQIEWYHNNELLDIKNGNNQATNSNNNYFSYHVRQTIMEENDETNTFRSLESRLALEFQDLDLASATNSKHNSNNYNNQQQKLDKRLLLIDRDRLLARRHFLNSSNFTCQSGPNSMGPSVRSTTKLVVQYPPENVLISAPSDKLNLVEGANGPLLSCEASGEPQVQYRWLLLRGAGNNLISSSDLVAARYNVKHFANSTSQQDNSGSATTTGTTNGSFAPMARPNDVEETERSSAGGSIAPAATARQLDTTGERIVELTGPSDGEQVGGTTISTLDLSNISIDRKQSGHYICEASNALGQTRQSVYVNVLYKPTCTTLHMHSLDFTTLTREPRHGSARPTAGGLPPKELALDEASSQEEADGNGPIVVATTKPIGAGKNDEYSMVRETSEDFIGLRRVLVMSPLLSSAAGGLLGLQQQQQTATAELASLESGFSLRGSIFSSMLDSSTSTNNNKRLNQPALNNGDATAALIHGPDSKDDSAASASRPANLIAPNQRGGITGDYWAKFNEVLLKFLNDYSRQIEQDEERRLRAQRSSLAGPTTTAERNQQQQQRQQTSSRRSSSSSLDRSRASIEGGDPESTAASDANELDRGDQDHHHHRGDSGTAAPSDKRHEDYLQQQARKPAVVKRTSLLTFACMAQEGNPMANLTFDWYFGSVRLPQASQYQQLAMTDNIDNSLANEQRGQEAANNHAFASSANQQRQPNIIYSNENETLAIVLTRRLDSGTMLNPFQMSFLTVNVIVVVNGPNGNNLNDDDDELQSRSSSSSSDSNSNNNITTTPMKAPVIKSRYQSFYGSLQAANYEQQPISTSSLTGSRRRSNNNNIQFGQEFGNHQRNHQQNYPQHHQAEIEINEHNWQERLGQLLSCSVSNSVGPSEACHVRVSLPSKLGANSNGLAGSSSLYGFAKWRMPSLAQKSLLIISILIGCSLIVFATFALLIGPHLRAMQLIHQKRPGSGASSSMTTNKDDQGTMHTGQSTSSQKSSMMGLLGNGADSSFPSSSDDDTSGRLNQLESSVCATSGNKRQQANFGRHHGNMLEMDAAELSPDDRLIGSTGGDVGGGGQFDYDLPRSATANMALHRPPPGGRLVYQPDVGNFNFQKDSLDYENYQYQYGHHDTTNNNNNNNSTNQQQLKKSTGNHHSTSSRILASLKSKFKGQDRISDFQGGNRWSSSAVHNRNVSNSETATTGISVSGLDAHNESLSTTGSGGGNHHGPMRTNSNRGGAMLHNLGVPVNLRHSYAGTRVRAQRHPSTSYQPMTMAKASSYYAAPQDQTNGHSLDDATYNRLVQLNSQVFINGQQQQHQGPPLTNAMDEFMRRRGLDTSTAFDHDQDDDSTLVTNYGSQSIRNQSSTMYSLRNELTQLAHKLPAAGSRVLKPPIYPRASATTTATQQPPSNYQISAMFKPAPPPPPPIAARASQRDQLMFNRHSLSNSGSISHQHNLFPMGPSGVATPYCEPNIMQGQQPFAGSGLSANTANRFDTIDTHLNRLADNVALGYYNSSQEQQQQQQIAYANAVGVSHQYAQGNQYDANSSQANSTMANNSSVNHIYDLNAYATPEQTPLRRLQQQAENQNQSSSILESERLRVSQLIQTFNTKHPEHSSS